MGITRNAYEVLGLTRKFRCTRGCRNGRGLAILQGFWNCSQEKGLTGCWECDSHATCEKLDSLAANHGDAHLKNLAVLHELGIDGFLKGRRNW